MHCVYIADIHTVNIVINISTALKVGFLAFYPYSQHLHTQHHVPDPMQLKFIAIIFRAYSRCGNLHVRPLDSAMASGKIRP